MKKIRIHQIAHKLGVKYPYKEILDVLPSLGITGKKTFSSTLEFRDAERLMKRLNFKQPDFRSFEESLKNLMIVYFRRWAPRIDLMTPEGEVFRSRIGDAVSEAVYKLSFIPEVDIAVSFPDPSDGNYPYVCVTLTSDFFEKWGPKGTIPEGVGVSREMGSGPRPFQFSKPSYATIVRPVAPAMSTVTTVPEPIHPDPTVRKEPKLRMDSAATVTQISKYSVLGVLGVGGMGVVYRAIDKSVGREVVIKTLTETTEELRYRFILEARSGILNHPNIVAVYEFGEQDGNPYIVMEFVPGDSLENLLRVGHQFTLIEKLDIIRQLCLGLAYAHQKGVIHRDITPANIMVKPDGNIKIVGFGVARPKEASGTFHHIAPERLMGKPADGRADIWSAGIILYLLLTGRLPFPGDDPTTLHRVVRKPQDPLSNFLTEYPPALDHVLDTALAKSASDRYDAAADMATELESINEGLKRDDVDRALSEIQPSLVERRSSAARPQATSSSTPGKLANKQPVASISPGGVPSPIRHLEVRPEPSPSSLVENLRNAESRAAIPPFVAAPKISTPTSTHPSVSSPPRVVRAVPVVTAPPASPPSPQRSTAPHPTPSSAPKLPLTRKATNTTQTLSGTSQKTPVPRITSKVKAPLPSETSPTTKKEIENDRLGQSSSRSFIDITDFETLEGMLSHCLREMSKMLDRFEQRDPKAKPEGLALRIHSLRLKYQLVEDISMSMLQVNAARNRVVKEGKLLRADEITALHYLWIGIKKWAIDIRV